MRQADIRSMLLIGNAVRKFFQEEAKCQTK